MKKFEYRIEDIWVSKYLNPNHINPEFEKELNMRGEDGWEVCGVYNYKRTDIVRQYTFKRKKE